MGEIVFKDVSKSFEEFHPVFSDVSFEIKRSDFVIVSGPTGAGKSTLLKLMYFGILPDSGNVDVLGVSSSSHSKSKVMKMRRQIGVIFQGLKLLFDRSAFENVMLPLFIAKDSDRDSKAYRVLKRMGLLHKKNILIGELSQGERQKVAIARAIVRAPRILIADEPFSNLSSEDIEKTVEIFKEMNDQGVTVIIATHTESIISKIFYSRVFYIENGEIKE